MADPDQGNAGMENQEPNTVVVDTPQGLNPVPTVPATGEGDKDIFPREYVEELRRESASYRIRAQEAEKKINEFQREKMTEVERLQADWNEEKSASEALRAEMRKLKVSTAVILQATDAFIDPQDAVERINLEEVAFTETGDPEKESVQALLDNLAKSKPYLLKASNNFGSADGGSTGTPPSPPTPEAIIKAKRQSLVEAGAIEIPV